MLHFRSMATTNSTGNEEQTSFEDVSCLAVFIKEIYSHLVFLTAVNSILSITAFLGNTLILVALHKESSLHAPSKLLFRSLATTDLCVGIIVEPLSVTFLISLVNERWNTCRHALAATYLTGYSLCSVSQLTLSAISVDRLLPLLLGLRYRQVVTLKRIYLIVTVCWVLAALGSTMYFWNHRVTLWFSYSVTSLCLVISIFCYAKIFITLCNNQVQAQGNVNQGQPNQMVSLNRARYRKTVTSALWVQ